MSHHRSRVVLYSPAHTFGGAERVLLTLAAGLADRGWEPLVVHEERPALAPLAEGCQERELATLRYPPFTARYPILPTLALAQRLRSVRPAVFHAQLGWPGAGLAGLAAAILAGVPVIAVTVHLWLRPPRRARAWHRLLAPRIGAYVAVSEAVAGHLRSGLGVPAGQVQVIRNGIDVASFEQPPEGPAEAFEKLGHPLVVTVAQLRPQKQLDLLVGAAERMPEVTFAIVGEGPERARLESLISARGLADRVRLMGFRDDIRPILLAADLAALPSKAEGLPLAVLEAMAAGLPVVASDIEGTREVVAHGMTGLLVPPNDAAELAAAIGRLTSDRALRGRLAAAGQALVRERFTAERMVDEVADLYRRLLWTKGGGEHVNQRAAMRSADWRYLAGRARWPRAIGADPASCPALGSIADEVDGEEAPSGQPADLVVATDRTIKQLLRGGMNVRPGGDIVILRAASPLPRSASPERSMAGAGIPVTGRWLAWPGQTARRWIPAHEPAALAWLDREVRATSRSAGPRRARFVAWRIRRRLGMLADVTVATWPADAPGLPPSTYVPPPLGRLVASATPDLDRGPIVLLAHGQRPSNKVVLLLLDPARAEPKLAIKIARTPVWNEGLEQEERVLRELARRGLGPADGVPHVLGSLILEDGSRAVAETALAGSRLSGAARRGRTVDLAERGTAWLLRLAAATASSGDPAARRTAALAILDRFGAAFETAIEIPQGAFEEIADAVAGLPIMVEHRDFAPWNLLDRADGSLAAVDWESAELTGWPGLDLVYFLTQLAFDAAGARTVDRQLAAYRSLGDPTTTMGSTAADAFKSLAASIGLESQAWPALRRLCWAIHALSEHRRAVEDVGPRPPAAHLARGLFVRLWESEMSTGARGHLAVRQ